MSDEAYRKLMLANMGIRLTYSQSDVGWIIQQALFDQKEKSEIFDTICSLHGKELLKNPPRVTFRVKTRTGQVFKISVEELVETQETSKDS